MCMGGGGSAPTATVQTPAVPVSDITAGHPTIQVIPPKPQADPTAAMAKAPAPSQVQGATGLNM
jgi:hypothetical protein